MCSSNPGKLGFRSRFSILCILLLLVARADCATLRTLLPTGSQPTGLSPAGKSVSLYAASHALLIAESTYLGEANKGWSPLLNTATEVDKLASVLQQHGFSVWIVSNATGPEINSYVRKFAAEFGTAQENRLLFFYTGHGHTNAKNDFGYLVPINAPDPKYDQSGFLEAAVPIQSFELIAHEIASRHAIFIFDSCFSGTIFKSKGSPALVDQDESSRWRFLSTQARAPARQFISAGSASERVPAKSVFLPLLIDALNGAATSAKDGFVTGREIGIWLAQNVPTWNKGQNPQSGMILDPELARGDITFQFKPPASRPPIKEEKSENPPQFVKTISYSMDVHFDYDKTVMRAESKGAADDFLLELSTVSLNLITIVGYVDKQEQYSVPYGQKLAMRRAESVKSYLITKGVPASRIYTEGKFVYEAKTQADLARSRRATISAVSIPK